MTNEPRSNDQPASEDLNDLMRRRREELDDLRAHSVDPYPPMFERADMLADVRRTFGEGTEDSTVAVAGRILSIRRMGKASFCHIADSSDRMQVYLKRDDLGPSYELFKLMDIGDIVGIRGFVFRTRMGEISVHAKELVLLAKSLRPLPVVKEKTDEAGNTVVFDPLSDKEIRYRQRYVDLIVNPQVRSVFLQRAKILSTIRSFFDARGYLEVETPILQPLYGGAAARPFTTHHNTLGIQLFLRIADELYLKRLIVGGFDAVYEIAKDFRNEGMDRTHNPEFTMLELYVAYKDYIWMMTLVEELFAEIARSLHGTTRLTVGTHEVDFAPPFRRLTMFDAIRQYTGRDLKGSSESELRTAAKELGLEIPPAAGPGAIIDEIFSERVEHHLIQPTFITDYPIEMSPLAKNHRDDPRLVERFELIVNGQELCNAFSELNDPLEQRRRFEEQRKLKARGDEETQPLDEDFIRALEYGMPPTAGLGVGIDRLVMLMTNQDSIRDVIFFPQMKPEA